MNQKRVVSIQDISCFGKCSITVSSPILSAAGIETVVLPTALLSTHTGGLEGYTFLSLENELLPIVQHWKKLGIRFDAIITGYVGSTEMIEKLETVEDLLKGEETVILSDPAMADNGVLYKGFDENYAEKMKDFCARADIVLPNITEACLMTGTPYREGPYTKEYIGELLRKLAGPRQKAVILTGVYFDRGHLGAALYDVQKEEIIYAFNKRIEGYYHGTGDIFANAFFGAYLAGNSFGNSLQAAVDFTQESIERTYKAKTDIRFGVNFEAGLEEYARKVHGK